MRINPGSAKTCSPLCRLGGGVLTMLVWQESILEMDHDHPVDLLFFCFAQGKPSCNYLVLDLVLYICSWVGGREGRRDFFFVFLVSSGRNSWSFICTWLEEFVIQKLWTLIWKHRLNSTISFLLWKGAEYRSLHRKWNQCSLSKCFLFVLHFLAYH